MVLRFSVGSGREFQTDDRENALIKVYAGTWWSEVVFNLTYS